MGKMGLLIEYDWCTGCHTCEVACQMEHELPVGQFGMKVTQIGPYQIDEKSWVYEYVPSITVQCDMCAQRQQSGKLPTCVQHCQSKCLRFMDVMQAAAEIESNDRMLFITN